MNTSRSLGPTLPLSTETDFPACAKSCCYLVHIFWASEFMGFMSVRHFPKERRGSARNPSQPLNLWVVTLSELSQRSVGITNTLASGKRFLNTRRPKLNSKSGMAWESWVLWEALISAALCDFTVALVLNTQCAHSLWVPSGHASKCF